mgnify:CR=1 FL=1
MLGLETMVALGVGGLLALAAGARMALSGRPYQPSAPERTELEALGLPWSDGSTGTLAGHDATLTSEGRVALCIHGLAGVVLQVDGRLIRPEPVRSRRAALDRTKSWLRGEPLVIEEGVLRVELSNEACRYGQLVPAVRAIAALVEALDRPTDWEAVAQDGGELWSWRIEALRRLPRPRAAEVASGLASHGDADLEAVVAALADDPNPLRQRCLEGDADRVLPLLDFLPPADRGAVLGRRVVDAKPKAHPFAVALRERIDGVGEEELLAIAAAIHELLDGRRPMFDTGRFEGLEGAFEPLAWAIERLADSTDREPMRRWLELGADMLDEADGTDRSALIRALVASASAEELPVLRRLRDDPEIADRIDELEARHDHLRGGLSIAEVEGGALSVVADTEPPTT